MNRNRLDQCCEVLTSCLAGKEWVGAMALASQFRSEAPLPRIVRLLYNRFSLDLSLAYFYDTAGYLEDSGVIKHRVEDDQFRSYILIDLTIGATADELLSA